VDYLADEVLDRQPDHLRRFLLDSAVLERLTGPLCDAVTGRTDGQAMLELLERRNLFIVPLDDKRRWYRYHRLFADVLQARLLDERPGDVPGLHRRAAAWYDRAGDAEAAVGHALSAGDARLAADLVELAIPTMLRERREDVIRRWVDQLPADAAQHRPVLAVGLIGGLMSSNAFDSVPQRLHDVRRLLDAAADDLVVLDLAEYARLPAAVETYSAALALVSGDLSGTVKHAEAALARADPGDHLTLASACALRGLACWSAGDLDAAHDGYRAASDNLARAGHVADILGCAITLADIEMTEGKLTKAQQTLEHALELGTSGGAPLRGAADMHVGLSRVAREGGNLAGAAEHLRRADELGESAGLPQNPYRWRAAMAHLRAAEGDTSAAIALLEEAERVYVGDFAPDVRPVAAARARVLIAAGDLPGAFAWARDRGISAADPLTYIHEYEHVTLARILLADQSLDQASVLLERLLEAADAGRRTGTVIEVLVLLALARAAAHDQDQALSSLERAIGLAEPEGYIQVFADAGRPLAALLHLLARRHRNWMFLRQLAAVDATKPRSGADRTDQQLVEPLSNRERDVLRLLASDLDGPAIARELGVSLTTVRTHTQHVYTKLGVNNRRAAVRRAHQLNLFAHAARR
jgi:LuxR family maltose regulon positive regulatory protein